MIRAASAEVSVDCARTADKSHLDGRTRPLYMYCTQPPGNPGTKLKAHTTRAPASRHLMREGGRSSLGNYMG